MGLQITTPIQMRFADVDSFGHVNNVALQSYYDLGKTDFFAQLWHRTASLGRVPAIIVSLKTDFMDQVRYGDRVEVQTRMVAIGHKSFTLRQSIVREGVECSRSQVVMVCFDAAASAATAVPDEWHQFLSEE